MAGVRQHVNPLGMHFMQPRAERMNIPQAYRGEVHVELGCADADFSFALAQLKPEAFVVGLEIREPMVARNQARVAREGIENLRFAYVNLNVDLDRVFEARSVHAFHLLFPDPWFKAKHQKRRVVEPWLCQVVAEQLVEGGELHFASDVFEVALAALETLESPEIQAMGFRNIAGPWSFARHAPEPVKSRRECTTLRRKQRVWRIRLKYRSSWRLEERRE